MDFDLWIKKDLGDW